jgi:hypothetical protein
MDFYALSIFTPSVPNAYAVGQAYCLHSQTSAVMSPNKRLAIALSFRYLNRRVNKRRTI